MKNKLMVVWTTDNKETVLNMVCLYVLNAKLKGWFDEITLLVWGASQQALSNDEEIQAKIKEIKKAGVRVVACKKCSKNLGIEKNLQTCGIEVFYTGELLSDWVKSGEPLMTF